MKTIRFFITGSSLVLLMWLSASFQAQLDSEEVKSSQVTTSAEHDPVEQVEEFVEDLATPTEEVEDDSFSEEVALTHNQ